MQTERAMPPNWGRRIGRAFYKTLRMLGVSYLVLFVIGPFVYASVMGASCQEWSSRGVETFQVPQASILEMAGATNTFEVPVLPGGYEGMAVGGSTLTKTGADADIILHEAVHHLQMKQEGRVMYSIKYASEWVRGMYHGCGPHDAYRYISYEVQARRAVLLMPQEVIQAAEAAEDAGDFATELAQLDNNGELHALLDNQPSEPRVEDAGTDQKTGPIVAIAGENWFERRRNWSKPTTK